MAIKVQVKNDKQFEDTFTTTECCNGTFANDAFARSNQSWAAPVNARNFNPAYTTTMLDGLCTQTPASLASLFDASTTRPAGDLGFKPSAESSSSTPCPIAPASGAKILRNRAVRAPLGTGQGASPSRPG